MVKTLRVEYGTESMDWTLIVEGRPEFSVGFSLSLLAHSSFVIA